MIYPLTTLTPYPLPFWVTTSAVLQSSHLNWADFIDSRVRAHSQHKIMPEKLHFTVCNFIAFARLRSLISPGIPQDVVKHWLATIMFCNQLPQKAERKYPCHRRGEEGKKNKEEQFILMFGFPFLAGVKPGPTLKLLRFLMRSAISSKG